MTALAARARVGFLLVLLDETGPKESTFITGDWRRLDIATVRQLVVAAWPSETVLAVEWADEPKVYSAHGDDVLLVRTPGTHEVTARSARRRRQAVRRQYADDEATQDDCFRHEHGLDALRVSRLAPAPVVVRELDDQVVIETCGCGARFTALAWEALELVSATDRSEGGTVIHEVSRACTCGAVRMVATKRLKGGAR